MYTTRIITYTFSSYNLTVYCESFLNFLINCTNLKITKEFKITNKISYQKENKYPIVNFCCETVSQLINNYSQMYVLDDSLKSCAFMLSNSHSL